MNFKKNIAKIAVLAMASLAVVGCSDWTEAEHTPVFNPDMVNPDRTPEYYAALRAWKAQKDHAIAFGWFSGWSEPTASMNHMLDQLPDSMGMISLWDNAVGLSDAKVKDLRRVQQVKGTKVLMCTFIQYIGKGFTPKEHDTDEASRKAFWGWVDGDEAKIKESMKKYAQAISDTIWKYGYDGLDIDFEPNIDGVHGHLDENGTYVRWFFEILKDYLGPMSGTGKLLAIDGELTCSQIPPECMGYFDFYISQAYSVSGGTPPPTAGTSASNMNSRLRSCISKYAPHVSEEEVTNKFIVTENMESALDALKGGFFWTTIEGIRQDKNVCPSLVGMALWQPSNGFRKGGFGGYRFDAEASNNPPYKWMRTAIQAEQHPENIPLKMPENN